MRENTRKVLKARHDELKNQLANVQADIDYQQSMLDGLLVTYKAQRDQIKAEMDLVKAELDSEPEPK